MIKKIYLLCLLLWSLAFLTLAALSQPIKVGEVAANPGEKKSGFILVPAGQDGSSVKIPVTVINGVNKGPILALIAGIHGYEYPPILALQRLHFELDPTQLSGAVILVHIANVPSFLKRTIYYNP
ncbi:MAG: succinylglutamate desuccinylase/aspartoacylase family protein, partial [Candidatus Aminicenantales bacterium]